MCVCVHVHVVGGCQTYETKVKTIECGSHGTLVMKYKTVWPQTFFSCNVQNDHFRHESIVVCASTYKYWHPLHRTILKVAFLMELQLHYYSETRLKWSLC